MFIDFDLVNPKNDGTMKILRSYGSKEIAKEVPRHPTRTNREPRFGEIQEK